MASAAMNCWLPRYLDKIRVGEDDMKSEKLILYGVVGRWVEDAQEHSTVLETNNTLNDEMFAYAEKLQRRRSPDSPHHYEVWKLSYVPGSYKYNLVQQVLM
jgi:hypothetical protein